MKKYSLLVALMLCYLAGGVIIASDFIKSTQQRLKETAVWYGFGSVVLHSSLTAMAPFDALMDTYDARNMAKKIGEKFPLKKAVTTFGKELKEDFIYGNKELIRTHRIAAPVFFGTALAFHTYDKILADKK